MMELPTEGYSLALAIEDLFPVIFSAIGLYLLVRIVKRADKRLGDLANAGVVLIVLGGAAKVAWKFTVAIHDHDIEILERALFGFMAPGFVFVAVTFLATTGIEQVRHTARVMSRMGVTLLIMGVAFGMGQSGSRPLELILLTITVIGSTLVLGRCIQLARARALNRVAAMMAFTLLASFALGGIGSLEQTIALQWTEQIINTVSQAVFALAAFWLSERSLTSDSKVPASAAPPAGAEGASEISDG